MNRVKNDINVLILINDHNKNGILFNVNNTRKSTNKNYF